MYTLTFTDILLWGHVGKLAHSPTLCIACKHNYDLEKLDLNISFNCINAKVILLLNLLLFLFSSISGGSSGHF